MPRLPADDEDELEPIDQMVLTDHFLIAMPAMQDPHFARSLTYICEHNEEGAMGIIVNRPIDLTLPDLFSRIDLTLDDPAFEDTPVYFGGPVQTDRGFVLHRPMGRWHSTLQVNAQIGLTSSRDILESVGSIETPGDFIVTLGYAGWSEGQLEEELAANAWLTVKADPAIIFGVAPEDRLNAAMRLLGVNFTNLSDVAGHA